MVNLKWLMNVLINVNMNGMVINSSTNEKNDSMNWWILYSNDVIWNIIDWLLWYIVTYYQYDMFNEWIMTFIFEYVNPLSEKRAQSMTIMEKNLYITSIFNLWKICGNWVERYKSKVCFIIWKRSRNYFKMWIWFNRINKAVLRESNRYQKSHTH